MTRSKTWACVAHAVASFGCMGGGLTLGENSPGDDTYLDDGRPPVEDDPDDPNDTPYVGDDHGWCVFNGSIAVDPRTEIAYTAVSTGAVECEDWWSGATDEKVIYGVEQGALPRALMDVTGKDDVRILFPQDQILVMAEENERDTLTFLDPDTYEPIVEMQESVRYHGTRMSHSRRFVAVADNTSDQPDIHLIDSATHEIAVIPHGGDWLEAMWANTEDRLFAIVFGGAWDQDGGGEYACILSWRPRTGGGFFRDIDERGLWRDPELDIRVDGVIADFGFSFTWVGVSPDDRFAVFPVAELEFLGDGQYSYSHQLIVVDLADGSHRTVHGARGPVGFTPDGSTIVSFRTVAAQDDDPNSGPLSELVLIDADDLEETTVPLGDLGLGPQFFVTRSDNLVVITNPMGGSSIMLHDVDSGTTTSLDAPNGGFLDEFVVRDDARELWMVGDGLWRLDYADAQYENVPLGFDPSHVNRLPLQDLLVLDDPILVRLAFFDPERRTVIGSVDLPTPDR